MERIAPRAGESVAREAPLYDLLAAQPVRDLEERVADARTDAEAGAAVHALLRAALARQASVRKVDIQSPSRRRRTVLPTRCIVSCISA
ncbi:MAG TPA: hypothetical protein VHG93_02360 [Longimicrobium sp.]|nr:hypothetical protein [Longimicrobium sp.]